MEGKLKSYITRKTLWKLGRIAPEALDLTFRKEFDDLTYFIMHYRYIQRRDWKQIYDAEGVHKSKERVMQLHKLAVEKFEP